MKNILKILKYLFIAVSLFISILIGVASCSLILLSCVSKVTILDILFSGLYFIPTILIFLIFFFPNKYSGKYSILLKTLSYIAICILVNFQITILAYTLSFSLGCNVEKNELYNPIRPISEYNSFVTNKNKYTKHFPDKIPTGAINVELYKGECFFGEIDEYLKFNIDDEYVNNELKKFKFSKIISGDKYSGNTPKNKIKNKDDIYYIFENESNSRVNSSKHYSYGIVVNRKTHEIIYYYSYY